ncbi:MAG: tRNA 2-selenouridine(34) synthase MnmH, partial [Acidobacteria bacterium]|nr:tRNA 2-selenouridine(34) synthase MnmH [Acidobacteriota bacterium]
MKSAPAAQVNRPIEERLDILTEMYGKCEQGDLIEATKRISKRLGGERTKMAIDLIGKGEIREACRIILDYYDRSYRIDRVRTSLTEFEIGGLSADQAAALLIKSKSAIPPKTVTSAKV